MSRCLIWLFLGPNLYAYPYAILIYGTSSRFCQKFQKATLISALRAAIALNSQIQRLSKFDRKHYFYQDQPNGYQITQYYGMSRRGSDCKIYTENEKNLMP